MRTLLNVIWVVFGGFWLFLGYLFFGVVACLFIAAILVSAIGSGLTMRRFLKV